MPLKQTGYFFFKCLTFWLVLSTVDGKASSLFPSEEDRNVRGDPTKEDNELVDNAEFPTGCNPRKLRKRSSSFGVSWLRGLNVEGPNCQIFPVTTETPLITKTQTTTKPPWKETHRIAAPPAMPGSKRWLWYFLPYRQYSYYNALLPINRGANGYNFIWHNKFQSDESSEEKRKKRDTFTVRLRKEQNLLGK